MGNLQESQYVIARRREIISSRRKKQQDEENLANLRSKRGKYVIFLYQVFIKVRKK